MGRIVRRFARFYEQENRGNTHIGLWATGNEITQYEADQVLFSSVIISNDLGGTVMGGEISVRVGESVVGNYRGLRVRAETEDNVVVTGSMYGMHLETSVIAALGQVTGTWEGIRLEMYSESGVASAIYGIFMTNHIPAAGAAGYYFQRMSENGGATVTAAFYFSIGGGGDMTNLFFLAGATTAWSAVTIPPGAQVGRIAVIVGGVQLYIPLWN